MTRADSMDAAAATATKVEDARDVPARPPPSRRRPQARIAARLVAVVGAAALVAGCGRGATPDDPAAVARGGELYGAHCASCHGGPSGGSISDIPPRHNAQGHTWHHGDCVLTEIIRDGPPPRPGATDFPRMPAFGDELSDVDIEAILAFIRIWWTEEQREFQAERTQEDCGDG